MSQGSITIPTSGVLSGAQLVLDINDITAVLASLTSGATDPSTTTGVSAFRLWMDTSVTPNVLRIRNAANTGWATVGTLNASNFVPDIQSSDVTTALGYTPANINGSNATGTWGISISGNASTATTATSATSATSADSLTTLNWTVIESGGELLFRYGGVTKAKISSDGTITSAP